MTISFSHFFPLLASVFLTWVCRTFRNSMALPSAIVGSLLIFYVVILIGGISLDDARESGYVVSYCYFTLPQAACAVRSLFT